jgi:hypothetical protein
MKNRGKKYTGLIRCILGFKPKGRRALERDVVSKFYRAVEQYENSYERPSTIANGKSAFGSRVSQLLDRRHNQKPRAALSTIQSLGHRFVPSEYSLVLVRGTELGRGKIKEVLIIGRSKEDATTAWQNAKRAVSASDW